MIKYLHISGFKTRIYLLKRFIFFWIFASILFIFSECKKTHPSEIQSEYFTKFFGTSSLNQGNDLCLVSDGGYVILGNTTKTGKGTDILLIKTDRFGNEEWSKTFGDSLDDNAKRIISVADGYVFIGTTKSKTLQLEQSDIIMVKTDKSGNLIWLKKYESQLDQEGSGLSATSDGGYVVTGNTTEGNPTNQNPVGVKDILILKTDNLGNVQWSKAYGGGKDETGNFILQKPDGGFILIGNTETYDEVGAGSNIIIIETNENGALTNRVFYGGAFNDYGECIQFTTDNNYAIIGTTGNADNTANIFIARLKSADLKVPFWSKTIETGSNTEGKYISETTDKGFVITGSSGTLTGRDLCLIKLSTDGNIVFNKKIGGAFGDEIGNSIKQTNDGGYIIAGSNSHEGPTMITLIKTNASGDQK